MRTLLMKKKSHSSPLALFTLASILAPIVYKAAAYCYHSMTDKEEDSWIPSSKDASTDASTATTEAKDNSDKFK